MRRARQIIAGITGLFITLYFIDLTGFLPEQLQLHFLTKIQVIPAILSGFIWAIVGLALLTLISGRLYCSTICPLGILQDLFIRLSKKRARKLQRGLYRKPHTLLRYSILTISIISLLLGSSFVALWLDPYSIFGRIASSILSPLTTLANNGIAHISTAMGSYKITHQAIHWGNGISIISAIAFLFILLYINIKHQRLWCNTLCPVGTLLGIVAKFSWLKIRIDHDKCISCKACSRQCKSNCINEKDGFRIDPTRCVMCFDCIDACKTHAITLTPKHNKHEK